MKKILSLLIAMLILFCTANSVFALDISESESQNVYARYSNDATNIYTVVLNKETPSTVTIKDGTEITVFSNNADDDGLMMVIIPISTEDSDAYTYVSDAVVSLGQQPLIWSVSFYKDDQRVELQGKVSVSVTIPNEEEYTGIYYLKDDAKKIAGSISDSEHKVEFFVDASGYYILLKGNTDYSETIKSNNSNITTEPNTTEYDKNIEATKNIADDSKTSPLTGNIGQADKYIVVIMLALSIVLSVFIRRSIDDK